MKSYLKLVMEIELDPKANMKKQISILQNKISQILLENYPELESVHTTFIKDSLGNNFLENNTPICISRNIVLSFDLIPKYNNDIKDVFDIVANTDKSKRRFIEILLKNYSEINQVGMQVFIALDFPPEIVKEQTIIGRTSPRLIGERTDEVTTQSIKFLLDISTTDDINKNDINNLKEEICTIIAKYSKNSNKFKFIGIHEI